MQTKEFPILSAIIALLLKGVCVTLTLFVRGINGDFASGILNFH